MIKNSSSSALRTLSNLQLADATRRLAGEERYLTVQVIAHLEEVEWRRLYLELGYPSLFEWCTQELKYSAAAAQRRIDAMRLSREIPEVREAVNDGRLNLSSVAQAQKFFRHEKKIQGKTYSAAQKRELLGQLEGASSRECERTLAALSPTFVQQERTRAISETQTQVSFVASAKLMEDLERIKHLWAHQNSTFTYSELFEKMARQILAKIDPMETVAPKDKAPKNKVDPKEKSSKSGDSELSTHTSTLSTVASTSTPNIDTSASNIRTSASEVTVTAETSTASVAESGKPSEKSRHIPAAVRRQVWQRDEGRCAHPNPQTGTRCGSTFMLEIDHINSFALGGNHDFSNLRLLCRQHNQLHAESTYGAQKMNQYRTG